MTRWARTFVTLAAALALTACATTQPGANISGIGTVGAISERSQPSTAGGIAGSVGGALAGGLVGSLIGSGSGRVIATGVGASVGAAVGGQAGAQADAQLVWDVTIRFDDGIDRVVRVLQQPALRPGTRVRVTNGVIAPL